MRGELGSGDFGIDLASNGEVSGERIPRTAVEIKSRGLKKSRVMGFMTRLIVGIWPEAGLRSPGLFCFGIYFAAWASCFLVAAFQATYQAIEGQEIAKVEEVVGLDCVDEFIRFDHIGPGTE